MTEGYVLKIEKKRHSTFKDSVEEWGQFSEAVPKFSKGNGSPFVVFIANHENVFTHVALGKGGIQAGTGLRKLKLDRIGALKKPIKFTELVASVAPSLKTHIIRVLDEGGILPPKSFLAVVSAIHALNPEIHPLLVRFNERRTFAIGKLGQKTVEALAVQKESLSTALQLADLDRRPLLEWEPSQSIVKNSFIDGLPKAYLREDEMIFNDLQHFPGMELIRTAVTGRAHFEDRITRLDVIVANRRILEEQTGADLIYYNATYKSFVMVQYKAMEHPSPSAEPLYRLPNVQLTKEVSRMEDILKQLQATPSPKNRHEYRLETNPFFIKLCPRIVLKPDDIGLTSGMYFSLDHWRFLETDIDMKGTGGGQIVTYSNVGRTINNTDFSMLVRNAWVGTTPSQSTMLEPLIREALENGRAITLAVKSDIEETTKPTIADSFDFNDDDKNAI